MSLHDGKKPWLRGQSGRFIVRVDSLYMPVLARTKAKGGEGEKLRATTPASPRGLATPSHHCCRRGRANHGGDPDGRPGAGYDGSSRQRPRRRLPEASLHPPLPGSAGPPLLDEPSRWLRSHRLSGSQLILRYLEPSSAPRPPRSGMTSARRGAKPAWCNGALRLHQQPSLRGNLAAALFGARPPRPCVSQIYGGQAGMRRRPTPVLSAVSPPCLPRPLPANAFFYPHSTRALSKKVEQIF